MGNNTDPREPPGAGADAPALDVDIFERPSAARSEGQLYAPPKTVPPTTAHRTIELETIKVVEEPDPRKAATVPRLRRIAPAAPSAPSAPLATATDATPPRRVRWLVGVVLVVAATIAYITVARMRSPAEPVPEVGNAGAARNPAARSDPAPAPPQVAPSPAPTVTAATATSGQPGAATATVVAPRGSAPDRQDHPARAQAPTPTASAKPAAVPDHQPLF